MTVSYSFNKDERLCSRKAISKLFESGEAFTFYPFRVYWNISGEKLPATVQLAVSVSKRIFKKAPDRNRIKRLIREAWRYNKHVLYKHLEKDNKQIILMLVYTDDIMPDYKLINNKIEKVVSKLLLLLTD